MVTSIVAVAVIWRYMLDPDIGIVNAALAQVGIQGPDWLGNPNTTMPSIIALGVWRNIGQRDGDLPRRAADRRPAAL